MIDEMFWPFAMKAIVEGLNSLQIYHQGRTPESILHGVNMENVLVKSFHTLFSPIYVLEARLQKLWRSRSTKMVTAFAYWGVYWTLARP